VAGLPANGLDTICSNLNNQNSQDNAGWNQLIITQNGANLRALSPNTGIIMNNSLFSAYYQPYVDLVWSKYGASTLTVNTQTSSGDVNGTVSNNVLTFANGAATYTRPSAADIFSCSSGPFAPTGNQKMDAITARLAAAFDRSTLLINSVQPNNENPSTYYQNGITNHYARILHATNLDGRGYAFPYDDVASSNGADQSGSVYDPNPQLLTVAVGGANASATQRTTQPAPSKTVNNQKGIVGLFKRLSCFK
jgi:hypothetical protein